MKKECKMKLIMNVCDADGKYNNIIECICRGKFDLCAGSPDKMDWDDVCIMVSESDYGHCWYSKKSNVRRLKKQFGENNRNGE